MAEVRPLLPGDVLREPGGVTAEMIRTTAADGDMCVEWTVPPGRQLAQIPHRHVGPEGWEVRAGTASHRVGRRRLTATAGQAWEVPTGVVHMHPRPLDGQTIVVRQSISPNPPEPEITAGVERYFETVFALAEKGGVDRWGRIKDPLQDALVLRRTLLGPTLLPVLPASVQLPLFDALAWAAERRGRKDFIPASSVARD